ncbi:MAG: hypothetical protein RL088_3919, partial [Verrucomicrobiota bacterium]
PGARARKRTSGGARLGLSGPKTLPESKQSSPRVPSRSISIGEAAHRIPVSWINKSREGTCEHPTASRIAKSRIRCIDRSGDIPVAGSVRKRGESSTSNCQPRFGEFDAMASKQSLAVGDKNVAAPAESIRQSKPDWKNNNSDIRHANTDLRVALLDVRPANTDLRVAPPDIRPANTDLRVALPDIRPANTDLRVALPDIRPANTDLRVALPDVRPANTDLRVALPDIRPANTEFRVAQPDIRPAVTELCVALSRDA